MKIGKYDVHVIETGTFALDGGAMFGIIPKPLWEKSNPPDEKNRIALATRSIMLVSDTKRVLIDTGMGTKWDEKSVSIYSIEQSSGTLTGSLKNLGFSPEDITDVLITHLHFDHTGGSTIMVDGTLQPAFPNATYHINERNLRWALEPTERDRGSYMQENFKPILDAGLFNIVTEVNTFYDTEIQALNFHGHTYGQQLIKISDGSTTLFYGGDLFPTSAHIPLPYIMGYDLQPVITLQEKKEILPVITGEEWIIVFEHDPFHKGAKVCLTGKGYGVKEFVDEF